jgi:hypothetical protein
MLTRTPLTFSSWYTDAHWSPLLFTATDLWALRVILAAPRTSSGGDSGEAER